MFYMHDIGWGWWLVMSFGMVAFWALVAYGLVVLVGAGRRDRIDQPPSANSPDDILGRRLAEGEISVEEYERMHHALHPLPSDKAAA